MICDYGCNQEANFLLKTVKKWCCCKSANSCPMLRKKNSDGLLKAISEGRKTYTYYNSLSQEIKDNMNWNKGNFRADFSLNGKGNHKQVLIQERGYKCEKCKNTHWLEQLITLELEHVDGNNKNNVRENLLLLCPNCHSQTNTWKRSKHTVYVSDEKLWKALNESKNIRQALEKVGLTGKGANYKRVYNLQNKYGHVAQSAGGSRLKI